MARFTTLQIWQARQNTVMEDGESVLDEDLWERVWPDEEVRKEL